MFRLPRNSFEFNTDPNKGIDYILSAIRALQAGGGGGGGVTSFNTRTGAVTLTSSDVTTALGYTPLSSVPTLDQVTTAGNTTSNSVNIGVLTTSVYDSSNTSTSTSLKVKVNRPNVGNGATNRLLFQDYVRVSGGVSVLGDVGSLDFFRTVSASNTRGRFDVNIKQELPGDTQVRVFSVNYDGTTYLNVNGGNTLIGTTTDAGYKLDVNGTVRVKGNIDLADQMGRYIYGFGGTYIKFYDNLTGGLDIYNVNGTGTTRNYGRLEVFGNLSTTGSFSMNGNLNIGNGNFLAADPSNYNRIYPYNGTNANMRFVLGHPTAGDFDWEYPINTVLVRLKRNGNFLIGTTTDNGYKLQVNGDASINTLTVGLGGGSVASNTVVGYQALINNTTGTSNTSIGYEALLTNQAGGGNTAIGNHALNSNTSGNYNVALGSSSSRLNTTGTSNVSLGVGALRNNNTGSSNIAVGRNALYNNTASNNTAVGYEAAVSNTSGIEITAIGYQALRNSTGVANTALGYQSLTANTTGAYNTSIGDKSLAAVLGGSGNTSVGYKSLYLNYGSNNTALGREAGQASSTGSGNVFLGYQAGYNETGSDKLYIANNSTSPLIYGDFSTGNVMIGTTTDTGYKLEVNGTARIQQQITAVNGILSIGDRISSQTGLNTGRMTMFNLRNTGGGYQSAVGTSLAIAFTNREVGGIWSDDVIENIIYSNSTGAVTTGYNFYTHNNQLSNASPVLAMSIVGQSIGIGTTTPEGPLHIKYSSSTVPGITIENDGVGFNAGSMTLRSGTTGGVNMSVTSGGGLYFYNLDTMSNTLSQPATGNLIVGGAVDAGYRLDVKGGDARFEQNVEAATYSVAGNAGYSGIVNFPSNPPGSQNLEFLHGILINVF